MLTQTPMTSQLDLWDNKQPYLLFHYFHYCEISRQMGDCKCHMPQLLILCRVTYCVIVAPMIVLSHHYWYCCASNCITNCAFKFLLFHLYQCLLTRKGNIMFVALTNENHLKVTFQQVLIILAMEMTDDDRFYQQ